MVGASEVPPRVVPWSGVQNLHEGSPREIRHGHWWTARVRERINGEFAKVGFLSAWVDRGYNAMSPTEAKTPPSLGRVLNAQQNLQRKNMMKK